MPDTKVTIISEMLLIIDSGFQIIYEFTLILCDCSYICPLELSQQKQVMIVDIVCALSSEGLCFGKGCFLPVNSSFLSAQFQSALKHV